MEIYNNLWYATKKLTDYVKILIVVGELDVKLKTYHGTNLSSAFDIWLHGVDLNKSLPNLDFGKGFYGIPYRKIFILHKIYILCYNKHK